MDHLKFIEKNVTAICLQEGIPQEQTEYIVGDVLRKYRQSSFNVKEYDAMASKHKKNRSASQHGIIPILAEVKKHITHYKKIMARSDLEKNRRAYQSLKEITDE